MALIAPPKLEALSLSLCILLSTYATYLSGRPPNPTPYNSAHPDSMSAVVTPLALFIRSFINVALGTGHAVLCLTYPSPPQSLCPRPSDVAPYLFSWTPHSAICIAIILSGCYIRLSAFSALGSNFTFRLVVPKQLVTSGLYSYAQHPSYTGKALIILRNMALVQRPDGLAGCWMPARVVESNLIWRAFACLIVFGAGRVAWKRVKKEEMMLKATFGKEWEAWHARTKRFVPGAF